MRNIYKSVCLLITFIVSTQCAWAQTIVTNEAELRTAVQTNNTNIQFANNIATSSLLEITNSRTVTIDMNGFTLDRGCTSRGSQVIVIRTGSTLNLSNGTLTGGWGGNGGALDIETGTIVNLTGVIITGNTADDRGGGIANSGTLTMTDCTLSGNTSRDNLENIGGGGLINYANCTATLTNVTIDGNNALYGGGLCNRGTMYMEGCTISDNLAYFYGGGIRNEGTLTMTECTVDGNDCSNESILPVYDGGGIYNHGTLNINGCNITGNTCMAKGNGIWNDATLNIQGNVQIKDNNDDDIYLSTGSKITVTDALTGGPGSIGVRMQTPGVFTSGYQSHNSETDHFFSNIIPNEITLVNGEMNMRYGYYECSWDSENKQLVHTMRTIPTYFQIANICGINNGGVLWGNDYWFIAEGTGSTVNGLTCNGNNIYLILCDDAEYTINEGFFVNAGTTLHIYCQSYGDRMGKLICNGANSQPGIGPKNDDNGTTHYSGNFDIHGGNIKATGGKYGAGIGGCEDRSSGTITIWDGKIEATGGTDAAGIGGGEGGSGTNTFIYGGNIKATGGDYGAGIGGGEYTGGGGGDCGRIEIFDGTIVASGTGTDGEGGGAGIGTGDHGNQNEESPIIIHGGVITATGGYLSAGIGSGNCADSEEITINGGIVMAYAGFFGAAIGAGCTDGDNPSAHIGGKAKNITINGGFVGAYAHSRYENLSEAAAIGGGFRGGAAVDIYGGTVFACSDNGAAIGSGAEGIRSAIEIHGGSVVAISLVGGAGIGGGRDCRVEGGYTYIYGGEVMAMGGAHKKLKNYASDPLSADKFISYLSQALLALKMNRATYVWDMLSANVVLVLEALTDIMEEDEYGGAGIGSGYGDKESGFWRNHIEGGYVVAHAGRSGAEAIGHGYDCTGQGELTISQGIMVSAGSDENHYAPVSAANRVSACRNNQYVYIQPCGHKGADSYIDNGDGTYSTYNEGGCVYCALTGEQTCHHTFTDDGTWNDANNWNSGHVPNDGNDVVICAHCEIPADYVAKADIIGVPYYDTIFIKDGGQLIHHNTGVNALVEKVVMPWTVEQSHDDILADGWYFIATPFSESYTPDTIMLSNTYDLYRLNNTIWENFKNTEDHPDFTVLNNGAGYLYANNDSVMLKLTGQLKPYSESDDANEVAVKAGWNLIGNPFTCNVYADRVFYKMNTERTAIEAVESYNSTPVAPVTGIIINADAAGTVTFKKDAPVTSTDNGGLQITLAKVCNNRESKRIDNAIVSFNEGSALPKFRFGNNAEIYIPQNGDDYAIASSDKTGEMPLYFIAKETGKYIISVETHGRTSLHGIKLIDKFADNIIDLNINNSYTFIGSPADSRDRFVIVFEHSDFSENSEIFAYQNGNDILINGDGDLQVFDVMGRLVIRKHVDGVETFPETSLHNGVYIFRLNEKTQKIVVK